MSINHKIVTMSEDEYLEFNHFLRSTQDLSILSSIWQITELNCLYEWPALYKRWGNWDEDKLKNQDELLMAILYPKDIIVK